MRSRKIAKVANRWIMFEIRSFGFFWGGYDKKIPIALYGVGC